MEIDRPKTKSKSPVWALLGIGILSVICFIAFVGFSYIINNRQNFEKKSVQPTSRDIAADTVLEWTVQRQTNIETAFFDVDCASVDECWVVGGPFFTNGRGVILHTIDGGVNWVESSPFEGYAYTIEFKPPSTIGVAGRFGKIYISHDKGTTWQTINPQKDTGPEDTPLYKFIWNGENDAWTTARQYIYHSVDNGQNWSYYHLLRSDGTPYQTTIFGIACNDEFHCAASGTGAKGFRTVDRGSTWALSMPQNYWNHLLDTHASGQNTVYYTGGDDSNETPTFGTGGVIFKSNDSGQTWTQLTIPQSGDIPSIRCIDQEHCIALSADTGIILKTADGGSNWTTESLNFQNVMLSVEYIDINNAMAVGRGIIMRYGATSGGGVTNTPTPSLSPSPTPPNQSITSTLTATPTVTTDPLVTNPTTTPAGSITQSPTVTATPSPSFTPTRTPTQTPTPTPSFTLTPTHTPSPSPLPSYTPTPSPAPTYAPRCDSTCGVCGWRDSYNICHPSGALSGSTTQCCYKSCVNRACILISGYGVQSYCASDADCAGGIAHTSSAPVQNTLTTPRLSPGVAESAPIAGNSRWALMLLVPVAIIIGAIMF